MVRIILHGCNGRMGQAVTQFGLEDPEIEIVAGIDVTGEQKSSYPVWGEIGDCDTEADAVIDFSSAKAVDGLLDYCAKKHLPVVLCTTGMSEEQLERVAQISKETAVLKSANMSLGVNTMMKLVQAAAKVLAEAGYDMEIVERHHNQKLDAPSGTAIALADAINEAMGGRYHYQYDRSAIRAKREQKEIGIQAVRGGSIVGDHQVLFCGPDEVVEIRHTAYSRSIFAKGALQAAKFLKGKAAGNYTMSDVIEDC